MSETWHWLADLRVDGLDSLVSARVRSLALSGKKVYVLPPALRRDGFVTARLCPVFFSGKTGAPATVEVFVAPASRTLRTACSSCSQAFGPCDHAATLAYDLACSKALRAALLEGGDMTLALVQAELDRAALDASLRFAGALEAWLPSAPKARRIEIAASAFDTSSRLVGRGYGDAPLGEGVRTLTLFVRHRGERKLLSERDLAPVSGLPARDRRVLEHATDRGQNRKALFVSGVQASLTLEAMRAHGGVHREGFRALLDFRPEAVRPVILLEDGHPERGFDVLSAYWTVDGGETRFPFSACALFPGPTPYLWTEDGPIHPVAAGVDLGFATQLARAPSLSVPVGRLHEAGTRLVRAARGRGIELPPNEVFGLPELEAPHFILRLTGDPLAVRAELLAVYRSGPVLIALGEDASATPDGAEDAARDREAEARARAIARSAGITADPEPSIGGEAEARGEAIVLAGERAIALWQSGLPALRDAIDPAIAVELTERLSRVRVGGPVTARVHVALEGDWLKTRLEFASEELNVEMADLRAALSKKTRWILLRDGTLARISSSALRLVDEAGPVMDGESERRLPPHQLGRIDRWIEENDGRMDASIEALRQRLRALAVSGDPEMPRGLGTELRPYQRLGLAWLQFLQALGAGGILADDMGLGKTVTTLAFLLVRKEREGPAPNLVVCPTSVVGNWVREAERFSPDLRVTVRHGPPREREAMETSDLVITTYALLRRDVAALSGQHFRCVVLDEAQNIKNADSATTRAAGRLNASMRLALSGTPVENRLGELWSLSSFANPGILGTARAFEKRFERPIASDTKSALAVELRAIVRPFLLRRTKNEVLRELPVKTELDRVVTLSRRAKRRYDALAHGLREGLARDLEKRGPARSSFSVFTALMRLRQMACDPRLVDPAADPDESAKRSAFLDIVRELVAEGRRALVFSQFVELLTLWRRDLEAEGVAYEYLDGSTTQRDAVVTRFQSGTAPLFLISLKAGGAGLNLTAADTVIHCDPWWNPAVEDQATDRAHRIGQDKPVTVIRLVAAGTIEEKIGSLKAKKRELTRAVIGDDARALEGVTEEDIALLLGGVDGWPDADLDGEDDDGPEKPKSPRDLLASHTQILDDAFLALAKRAQKWLETTGRSESELSDVLGIPVQYVAKLRKGDPFPCSRALAETALSKLRAW